MEPRKKRKRCRGLKRIAGIDRNQIGIQETQRYVSFLAQNGGLQVSGKDMYSHFNNIKIPLLVLST